MTGNQVRDTRRKMGLSVAEFARLLHAHLVTIYRWEECGAEPIKATPLYAALLAHFRKRTSYTRAFPRRGRWIDRVAFHVRNRSPLDALAEAMR